MQKKILSTLITLSIFALSACGESVNTTIQTTTGQIPATSFISTASTTSTTSPLVTTQATSATQNTSADFKNMDNSTFRGLYYLDYKEDYKFDNFIERGGASSTVELVQYAYTAFPEIELNLSSLGYGCSSFCAQSTDGNVIFGRNFDMSSESSSSYLIVHTAPENGYESYSTVNLSFLGVSVPEEPKDGSSPLLLAPYVPLDGINSAGLAICVLQLNFPEIHESGSGVNMTSTTIIRNVLDNAATVEEAIEIFRSCNIHTDGYAYHYMIGDAGGKSAVIEFVNNEMTVVYKTGEIQVCANTYVTEEGIEFYKDANSADSLNRMNAIESSVRGNGFNLTEKNAFLALSSASVNNTRWSIVYNLTEKTLSYTINRNFNKTFSFSFEK